MEEEIKQTPQQVCTSALFPTQTLLGLIKQNSNNNNNINSSQQCFKNCQNINNLNFNTQQICARNEDIDLRQLKSATLSSGKTSIISQNNSKIDNSFYETAGFNSLQQKQLQSPCIQFTSSYSPFSMDINDNLEIQSNQMDTEIDEKPSNDCMKTAESTQQSQIIQQSQQVNAIKQLEKFTNIQDKINIPCQGIKICGLLNQEFDSAQQPYYTKQKKQIQPCCANESNNYCKYTKFLLSNDQLAQLEALKYFETNLKDYNATDLLRLFNHKFIDCLVDKSKNFKQEKQIATMSMKVIFTISRLNCQTLIYNNKNIFFDKLLALQFPQVITMYKQDKVNFKTPCCLTKQIDELNIKLKKYQYEIENIQKPSQSSSSQNKPRACFLSALFK